MRIITLLFVLAAILVMNSGCAKMISPYPTEPPCRAEPGGECQSAYDALAYSKANGYAPPAQANTDTADTPAMQDLYKEQLYAQYRQLLTDDITPVIAPPKIVRMYFVPHEQLTKENLSLLNAGQYIYWQSKPSSWVLENLTLKGAK